jgi:hypothetical protein
MPIILATWEAETRRIKVGGQSGQIVLETPISKAKWTGGVAQMVECLLCELKTLSSNPTATKKEKKKKGWRSGSSGRMPASQV